MKGNLLVSGVLMAAVLAAGAIFAACGGSDGVKGRQVPITILESGCVPTYIEFQPGETVQFVVDSQTKTKYALEGVNADIKRFKVGGQGSGSRVWEVPREGAPFQLKCSGDPVGNVTIIELGFVGMPTSTPTPVPTKRPRPTPAVTGSPVVDEPTP